MARKRPSMGDLSGLHAALYPTIGDLSGLSAALLARRPEVQAPMREEDLPPGVERTDAGQLIRKVMVSSMDRSEREQVRPVVLTLAEAKATRKDYYHPRWGWMRYGYKFERDRPPEDVMEDGSSAVPDPSLISKD